MLNVLIHCILELFVIEQQIMQHISYETKSKSGSLALGFNYGIDRACRRTH